MPSEPFERHEFPVPDVIVPLGGAQLLGLEGTGPQLWRGSGALVQHSPDSYFGGIHLNNETCRSVSLLTLRLRRSTNPLGTSFQRGCKGCNHRPEALDEPPEIVGEPQESLDCVHGVGDGTCPDCADALLLHHHSLRGYEVAQKGHRPLEKQTLILFNIYIMLQRSSQHRPD